MKHVILKTGLFRRTNKNEIVKDELSFTTLIKRVLNYFNVPLIDPCCDIDLQTVPVRFNKTNNKIEGYVDGDWVEISL